MPVFMVLVFFSWKSFYRRLHVFSKNRLTDLLGKSISKKRMFLKSFMLVLSVGVLIVAIARPRWGYVWKKVPRGGVDIMVVLDLSRSMLATDVKPNRLEHAKREILEGKFIKKNDIK